ncbi:TPA: dTDP-4-keto-6-deoxy-D-glucose epimerase [Candidatus Micrarchaeota archaeon]|nr:dTDP-4-keto-6-deoxy-D-glucose epimerase [Candidatus Micrarchaeota archaeon]
MAKPEDLFSGAVRIQPIHRQADARGTFEKIWQRNSVPDFHVDEVFYSFSKAGTVRGLHYLEPPHTQARLIKCISGEVLDIVVDLRKGSHTFAKYETIHLKGDEGIAVYIPEGFAHGFHSITDSWVTYLADKVFEPAADRGVRWNDPDIGIPWAVKSPIISDKDANLPFLRDIKIPFSMNDK